jgi:hypothetical protein
MVLVSLDSLAAVGDSGAELLVESVAMSGAPRSI